MHRRRNRGLAALRRRQRQPTRVAESAAVGILFAASRTWLGVVRRVGNGNDLIAAQGRDLRDRLRRRVGRTARTARTAGTRVIRETGVRDQALRGRELGCGGRGCDARTRSTEAHPTVAAVRDSIRVLAAAVRANHGAEIGACSATKVEKLQLLIEVRAAPCPAASPASGPNRRDGIDRSGHRRRGSRSRGMRGRGPRRL